MVFARLVHANNEQVKDWGGSQVTHTGLTITSGRTVAQRVEY